MPSREFWEGFNQPYEDNPETTWVDGKDFKFAGACTLLAAAIPSEELGPQPAIVFRFVDAEGKFFDEPVVLVLDQEHLAQFGAVVMDTVVGAIAATQKMQKEAGA